LRIRLQSRGWFWKIAMSRLEEDWQSAEVDMAEQQVLTKYNAAFPKGIET